VVDYEQRKDLRRFQLARRVPVADGGTPIDVIIDFLMPRDAEIVKNDPPPDQRLRGPARGRCRPCAPLLPDGRHHRPHARGRDQPGGDRGLLDSRTARDERARDRKALQAEGCLRSGGCLVASARSAGLNRPHQNRLRPGWDRGAALPPASTGQEESPQVPGKELPVRKEALW